MVQVTEFFDAYPNYSLGFAVKNPLTATEKLLNKRHNSIAMSNKYKGRYYQAYWLTDNALKSLLLCFPEEHKVESFYVNNGQATFRGVRNEHTITCVCLETHERVMFTLSPFDN